MYRVINSKMATIKIYELYSFECDSYELLMEKYMNEYMNELVSKYNFDKDYLTQTWATINQMAENIKADKIK